MKTIVQKITKHLLETYSVDISIYDSAFLERSINERIVQSGKETMSDYFLFLKANEKEGWKFIDSLQIIFSEFFRNPFTYTFLEQFILPDLIKRKENRKEKEIRIWSCACAEGQEPYSIAILWDQTRQKYNTPLTCRIFATDINDNALETAKRGIYREQSLKKVTLEQIKNYFILNKDTYTLSSKIKDYVYFSRFDLLSNNSNCPPVSIFGNFDIVVCCNVLFYFKPEYRDRIIGKALHCLERGGYLVTGETEKQILMNTPYKEIFPNSVIFKKT